MKKSKVIIIVISVLVICIIGFAVYMQMSKNKGDYSDFRKAESSTESAPRFDPSYAPTMVDKVNEVLPTIRSSLLENRIYITDVTEDDISYSADTSFVTIIYPKDYCTQYVQIHFNEDGTLSSFFIFDDLEGDPPSEG